MIKPRKELVFLSACGAKAIAATAAIGSKELPPVLLDSDGAGQRTTRDLREGAYALAKDRVLEAAAFADVPEAEIEDLMPRELMIPAVEFLYRTNDETLFGEDYDPSRPIVPQIESYCARQGIVLARPNWKLDLALDVQRRAMRKLDGIPIRALDCWQRLFGKIVAATDERGADLPLPPLFAHL